MYKKTYKTPNKLDQERKTFCHILIKTPNVQDKEGILKSPRGKDQVTHTLQKGDAKRQRAWADMLQMLSPQAPDQAIIHNKSFDCYRSRKFKNS